MVSLSGWSVSKMNTKIVVAFALVAIAAQTNGGCLCHFGHGRNVCHDEDGCLPMVVRPAKLPKISLEDLTKPRIVCKQVNGLSALKPIGDLCSCKQAIVTPAVVPRPHCQKCAAAHRAAAHLSHTHTTTNTHTHHISNTDSHTIAAHIPEEPMFAAPADPVSLSLAYQAQQKSCGSVNEDRLAFGFRKLPADGSKPQKLHNLNEGNLHQLMGHIVEMVPVACGGSSNVDEEAMEQLEAMESETDAVEPVELRKLTYGDLGFRKSTVQAVPFVSIQSSGNVNPQPVHFDSSASQDCNDGFVAGNVVFKNTPRRETYVSESRPPVDCDYDDADTAMPVRCVSYSASSSSSNHHKQHAAGFSTM